MPKWMTAIIACYLSLSLFAAQAQSVDDIISKYEDALGGKEKLTGINSVYQEGVSVNQNGNEITSKITRVNKELLRTDVNFGMGSFSLLVTDKAGWVSNPRSGGKFEPMPQETLKSFQGDLDCAGPLVNYAAKGSKAELAGKEIIEGKECFKIRLTQSSGNEITYFIDPVTYYIVRDQRKTNGMMNRNGDGLITTDYADYQKNEDGYIFPYSVKKSGMAGNTIIEKIDVNKPVDPKLYKPE
jgi:hypothetical protein